MTPHGQRHGRILVRRIVAAIVGVLVANLVILGIEAVARALFPFDLVVASATAADLTAMMAAIQFGAKLAIAAGWLLGALAGTSIALRIAQWRPVGWVVTAFVIVGGLFNLLQLPHPLWMQVATVAAPLAGGWLAERWYHRARRGDPLIG